MGHIANKIDAKDKKLSEVLVGQRYRIDAFQREYRWQRKQIEALISDLVISFKKNYKEGHTVKDCNNYDCYYMGPIVLCDNKNELSIVDGQQRLSSLTLLFIYLYHQQNKIVKTNLTLRDLKTLFYVTKAGETTFVLNVKPRNRVLEHLISDPDSIFSEVQNLENAVEGEEEESGTNSFTDESIHNLLDRYEDITKLFPDEIKDFNILPIFIEWLLEKVVLVEVKAYSIENAYTIFETMNDRGMTLNPTEILKAFLLHKIDDDEKSNEVNEFWEKRISEIKSAIGSDTELDFFRAWLRAKYAESKRENKQGAENEDFELIGTQFHAWVKDYPEKVNLSSSDDYYFFIRSDFDFFSNLYRRIYEFKNKKHKGFEELYYSNFYPIADSLAYPLIISPVSKIDEPQTVDDKINIVSKFIDIYTLNRVILGKAITQSTIRNSIYELVKSIRNLELTQLKEKLSFELEKINVKPYSPFTILHKMDNWGFYAYLFARLLHKQNTEREFTFLLRSRKHNSLILHRIFEEGDRPDTTPELFWNSYIYTVAGHCLIRRNDWNEVISRFGIDRLKYLVKQGYMPEMKDEKYDSIIEFIEIRDRILNIQIDELLKF